MAAETGSSCVKKGKDRHSRAGGDDVLFLSIALPQRFIEHDADADGEIQAPGGGIHRNPQTLLRFGVRDPMG